MPADSPRKTLSAASASRHGAALVVGLHLLSYTGLLRGAASVPGAVRQAVQGIAGHIVLFHLEVLACLSVIGALFGLASWLALQAFGIPPARWRILLSATAIGLLVAAHAIARRPAIFEYLLWRRGGWRANLEVAIAEKIGVSAIDGGLAVASAVVMLAVLIRYRRCFLRPGIIGIALATVCVLLVARLFRHGHASQPAIVLLVADSLRPDHLSSSGYPRRTTPNIDALRARGAFVEDFFVPLASTTPSWTTYLTGVYPHRHGVRDIFPRREQIRIHRPTVPRLLAAEGYESVAVADYAGDFFSRLDYGFTTVDAPPSFNLEIVADRESLQRMPIALAFLTGSLGQRLFPVVRFLPVNADPDALTSHVTAQIDRLARGAKPFFLAAFYSVSHLPFAAPMPDAALYTDPGYRGRSRYSYEIQQITDIARAGLRPSEAEVEQVRALYDGSLHAFDRQVAEVIRALDRDGVKNRIVIIAGDHSEGLFEPGNTTEHGKWFVGGPNAANRTTFIFAGTGVKPGTIGGLASGVDFAPTLLDLVHVAAPADLDGLSLVRTPPPEDRIVFAESVTWNAGDADRPLDTIPYPSVLELLEPEPDTHALVMKRRYADVTVTARLRAARQRNWELVYTPTPDGSRVTLFDLPADPFALRDVSAAHPAETERLRTALLDWMAGDPLRWLDNRDHLVVRRER